ncbi:MAG: FGGY family carbohydrate kinase [Actinobacteria bacterium]|nr:FGGY family carbohydrate kinase [Actinomycetota bacterium]
MKSLFFIGIDIGTSNCKVVIYTISGKCIAGENREYNFPQVDPDHPEILEIDPEELWKRVCQCTKAVIRKAEKIDSFNRTNIVSVGISGVGETICALGRDFKPLYNFIESDDGRDGYYQPQITLITSKFTDLELMKITGMDLSGRQSVMKILWFKQNLPKIYEKVHKFACLTDYINFKLTGNLYTDYTMAARTMLFDVKLKNWSHRLCMAFDIDINLLSEAKPSDAHIGDVTPQASKETGIPSDASVCAGGMDQNCAALGAGVFKKGPAFDGLGTVECFGLVSDEQIVTHDTIRKKLVSYPHISGKYFNYGSHSSAGLSIRWARDVFSKKLTADNNKGSEAFKILIKLAQSSKPGAKGIFFLPHLRGSGSAVEPARDPSSSGAFVGIRWGSNTCDLARAVVEGTIFEGMLLQEAVEQNFGKCDEIRVTGGLAQSDFYCQLKSSASNRSVKVPYNLESGTLGAAILAAICSEEFSSIGEAADSMISISKTIEPDADLSNFFQERLKLYRELYPTLLNVSRKLYSIRTE